MEIKRTVILPNPSWCNGCKFLDNYPKNQRPVNARCVLGYWNQLGNVVPQMQKLMDWKISRPSKCWEENGQSPFENKVKNKVEMSEEYHPPEGSLMATLPHKTYTREDYKKSKKKKVVKSKRKKKK